MTRPAPDRGLWRGVAWGLVLEALATAFVFAVLFAAALFLG